MGKKIYKYGEKEGQPAPDTTAADLTLAEIESGAKLLFAGQSLTIPIQTRDLLHDGA